jgi:hypothetical protein
MAIRAVFMPDLSRLILAAEASWPDVAASKGGSSLPDDHEPPWLMGG